MPGLSRCRSCGAPIIWVKKPAPKPGSMPLDAEPGVKGNVLVGPDGRAVCHRGPVPGGRMAHHATCPHREHWKAVAQAKEAT
jgi:hypothetical protein